jgi:hypothetical protein
MRVTPEHGVDGRNDGDEGVDDDDHDPR